MNYANKEISNTSIMSGDIGGPVHIVVIDNQYYLTNDLEIGNGAISTTECNSATGIIYDMETGIYKEPKENKKEPWHNQFKKKKRMF